MPLAVIVVVLYPFANILRNLNELGHELSVLYLIEALGDRIDGDLDFFAFLGYAFNSVLDRVGLLSPLVHTIENFDTSV